MTTRPSQSPVDHLLIGLGVPCALGLDLRVGNVAEVVGGELHVRRRDVLLETVPLCGAGDRDDPRPLREQPREGHLRGRCTPAVGDPAEQVAERPFGPAGLAGGEPRDVVAEVTRLELRALIDRAGEETLAERAERNEADPQLLEHGEHRLLWLPPPQRVLALQRGHRWDAVGPPDCLRPCLGEAEVPDLPLLNELLDGAGDVLDGNVGVDAVLVEQVDGVGAQPPQRLLHGAPDRVGTAVEAPRLAGGELETELGGDDDLVTDRFERLADEFLVREWPVDLRRVEERQAALDGGADEPDHVLPVGEGWEARAHPHAAQPSRRDLQAGAEGALVHRGALLSQCRGVHSGRAVAPNTTPSRAPEGGPAVAGTARTSQPSQLAPAVGAGDAGPGRLTCGSPAVRRGRWRTG